MLLLIGLTGVGVGIGFMISVLMSPMYDPHYFFHRERQKGKHE